MSASGEIPTVESYKGGGFAVGDGVSRVRVDRQHSATADRTVVAGPVQARFLVEARGEEHVALTDAWRIQRRVAAGETVAVLAFVPGARLDRIEAVSISLDGVPYAPLVTTGAGSRLVRVGDGSGAALVSNGLTAGSVTVEHGPDAAIVGGLSFECASQCETTWRSPDGRSGAWSQERELTGGGAAAGGQPLFAGPAGPWSWEFTGVQDGQVIGAYAPLGDRWTLFSWD